MTEEWRAIVGWEGFYEVSSEGRVRSLARIVNRKSSPMKIRPKLLKPVLKNGRHLSVQLRDTSQGRTRTEYVHHLVARAFLPNPEGYPVVRHWDDDAFNNSVRNLRWGTSSDNAWDKVRNGRHHNTQKTHCPSGHPYRGNNLLVSTRRDGSKFRMCRECLSRRSRSRGYLK